MTTDLPETPESRKESYLADIAGQEVVLPERPLSREEQYLAYIAENGGGGGTYNDFIGTDGTSAGTHGLVPAPATTDAGKFLKADGTWATAGGGGGDAVRFYVQYSLIDTMGEGNQVELFKDTALTMAVTRTEFLNAVYGDAKFIITEVDNGTAFGDYTVTQITNEDGAREIVDVLIPTARWNAVLEWNSEESLPAWSFIMPVGVDVFQSTGTSEDGVMSQNAVTKMIFPKVTQNPYIVEIGRGSIDTAAGSYSVGIGGTHYARGDHSVAIGPGASVFANGNSSVAVGKNAKATNYSNSVALGAYSMSLRDGEVNVGTGGQDQGFNNSDYRVIGGVHDGQTVHDAATVAQGNTLSTSAPTTSTEGVLGQLWTDTTNMHTYQCTAISGNTYTWTQRW